MRSREGSGEGLGQNSEGWGLRFRYPKAMGPPVLLHTRREDRVGVTLSLLLLQPPNPRCANPALLLTAPT